MRNLCGVLLERRIAVRIAIYIKCESHFVIRRFLSRPRRRSWRYAGQLFCRLASRAKFLPQQRSWRNLPRGILPLQRSQLAFQLSQRKRYVHFRCDEKRLNEKHQRNEEQHTADEQNEA